MFPATPVMQPWEAWAARAVTVNPGGSLSSPVIDILRGQAGASAIATNAQRIAAGFSPYSRLVLGVFDSGGTPFEVDIEGDLSADEIASDLGGPTVVETLTAAGSHYVTRDLFWPHLRVTVRETTLTSSLTIYAFARILAGEAST